jgi:N-methylhydantoinase A
VTDANLVLGRLEPGDFLGGDMALDLDAAKAAIDGLAAELGLDPLETAEGVLTILNANMANAIRSRTVQRGIDPREFSLVAMGGAGPLQGAEVAQMLELREVIVPPNPGITSALGLLIADLKYDVIRTEFQVSNAANLERFNSDFDNMEAELKARLAEDHVSVDDVVFERAGDLRYLGQGYELRVPFEAGTVTDASLQAAWDRFHAQHAAEYGHAFKSSPIEVVNLRVTARGHAKPFELPVHTGGGSLEDAHVLTRDAVFRTDGTLSSFETQVYRRDLLPQGVPVPGPAILLQKDSTTVVPPGAVAEVHPTGSVIITLEAKQ